MKKLYLLMLPFMFGCMSTTTEGVKKHNVVSWINPLNWGKSGTGEITAATPFIPYHYGAIALFMFGVVCIAWERGGSKTGITCVVGSVALSAWATIMPKIAPYVSVILIAGAVLVAGYLVVMVVKGKLDLGRFKRGKREGDS